MNTSSADNEHSPTEAELLGKAQRADELIPSFGEQISISEAFALQKQIAEREGVMEYKDQNRFVAALRKWKLTIVVQGPKNMSQSDWIAHGMDEKLLSTEEVTGKPAVEKLFELKAAQRKKLDRDRKAAKEKSTAKSVRNNSKTSVKKHSQGKSRGIED